MPKPARVCQPLLSHKKCNPEIEISRIVSAQAIAADKFQRGGDNQRLAWPRCGQASARHAANEEIRHNRAVPDPAPALSTNPCFEQPSYRPARASSTLRCAAPAGWLDA